MVESMRPTCLACNPKTEASVFSSGAARLEGTFQRSARVPLCKLAPSMENHEIYSKFTYDSYDALVWNDKGSSYASWSATKTWWTWKLFLGWNRLQLRNCHNLQGHVHIVDIVRCRYHLWDDIGGSLHVILGQRETLWNVPVAEEIFGRLEPFAKISVRSPEYDLDAECFLQQMAAFGVCRSC